MLQRQHRFDRVGLHDGARWIARHKAKPFEQCDRLLGIKIGWHEWHIKARRCDQPKALPGQQRRRVGWSSQRSKGPATVRIGSSECCHEIAERCGEPVLPTSIHQRRLALWGTLPPRRGAPTEPDHPQLKVRLDGVPALQGRREVSVLQGGLTNHNYRVDSAGGSFVVRISDPDTGLLAIDRENEYANTLAAAAAGVGAGVVAYQPEHGMLVLEFIEAETMSRERMQRGDRLAAAAAAMRQLHAGPAFRDRFDMFNIQRGYRRVCEERGFALPDRYDAFEPQVRRLEVAMLKAPEPLVPCNNDLLAENFMWDGTRFRLIDYEYSGMNEASFELGNVWSESGLSLEQLEQLVASYWGEATPARVARARLWGLMSKYGWTLWGVIQHNLSEIDFDFWEWLLDKHDRATLEFDSPEFDRLIADLEPDG